MEGPLNTGVFLANSARSYDYTKNLEQLQRRLPVLRRMIAYVLDRYQYSKTGFPVDDRRHGYLGIARSRIRRSAKRFSRIAPVLLSERGMDVARLARTCAVFGPRGPRS